MIYIKIYILLCLSYKSINYTTIEDLEVLKDYRFKNISIDFIEDVDDEEIMKIKNGSKTGYAIDFLDVYWIW